MLSSPLGAFWISLACSAVLAYPTYRLLLKLGSKQTISEFLPEHSPKQGTPTMGGLMFLPGLILVLALTPGGWPAACLVVGFAVIGFLDDFVIPKFMQGKRGLGWAPKMALQMLVALCASMWQFAPANEGGSAFAVGLSIFLILFCSNAFNFADGMDGLASCVLLALSPALLVLVTADSGTAYPTVACGALIGGILPFLVLNAPPAKLFMGDVGALPIGAVLGFALVPTGMQAASWNEGSGWIILALVLASGVLILELVPVALQILWVKLRKKRLFRKTPVHHWLQDVGWPETRVVAVFAIAQLVLSVAAITVAARFDERMKIIEGLSAGEVHR